MDQVSTERMKIPPTQAILFEYCKFQLIKEISIKVKKSEESVYIVYKHVKRVNVLVPDKSFVCSLHLYL